MHHFLTIWTYFMQFFLSKIFTWNKLDFFSIEQVSIEKFTFFNLLDQKQISQNLVRFQNWNMDCHLFVQNLEQNYCKQLSKATGQQNSANLTGTVNITFTYW